MMAEMTATVENGMLKTDAAVPFPDQTRVKLTIEVIARKDTAWSAWQALLRNSTNTRSSGSPAPIREKNCMNAIDTNVFVYAFDATEPAKQSKAREFFRSVFTSTESTLIPRQVAVELLARFRKWEALGKMTGEEVGARFGEFLGVWTLALPTAKVFDGSFRLRSRHSLSHWDSLLVTACQQAGVTRLYSEDMQNGADYDGVNIVNPFG
jgi:predicted nucleic acid-binding protein